MYDFKTKEKEILEFWKKNKLREKANNPKGKTFYFLQGPPYTSGRLHMGHAWNNSAKDIILRYKRMNKFNVWDRAGYDMHGLPTAHKVQAQFKLETKKDIEKFGLDKFVKECVKFSKEKAKLMDEDLTKLGIWMDFENAYHPIDNDYIEGEWWLIKQAHKKNRLYEGKRTLSWCAHCETALAKHEQEYKTVEEPSVFVKFKVKDSKNKFLIIWTTTPWTLPYNLAIMVNPELDYVEADVEGEIWILSKALAAPVVQAVANKTLKITKEFKGETLEGLEYEHFWPLEDYKKLKAKHPKVHTVILSEEYVDTSAGTGLVHCAPGCGPEDYEVGHRNNIPAYNNLSQKGIFPENMAQFAGKRAKKDDAFFIEELKKSKVLIETTPVEHEYPHCERCHEPVIFRTTKQWFFKVEDMKDKMVKANEKIHWVPEAGKNAFDSWLKNLRDNSITKQRFWGTPLPIWKCESCKDITVIGSKEELEKLAGKVPENLHKPWIDKITFKCEKCSGTKKRLPDILDVWIDAGTASWNCLYYPQRQDLFKKYFPADFILEAKEQVRGWFNLLMVSSYLAFDKPCFKNVFMHGMLTDVEGVKMSKSLGNVISPYEIIDKYGSDTLRYYMCQTKAGEDINFSWDEAQLKFRNLTILHNLSNFLIDSAKTYKITPKIIKAPKLKDLEEKYILSKLNSTIQEATKFYESYDIDKTILPIEELFLELSRTYIQQTRDKLTLGTKDEKQTVLDTIYTTLLTTIKLFAPICPFITEALYQDLKENFKLSKESIHLEDWPKEDKKLINKKLETEMQILQDILQAILAAREQANINVRWPLSSATILTQKKEVQQALKSLEPLIKQQTNIKNIITKRELKEAKVELSLNHAAIGRDFKKDSPLILQKVKKENLEEIKETGKTRIDNFELTEAHLIVKETLPENLKSSIFRGGSVYINTTITPELEQEGYARELTRRIQALRKDAGLQKSQKIKLIISSSYDLEPLAKEIKEKTGAKDLTFNRITDSKHKSKEKIKNQTFEIGFDVI